MNFMDLLLNASDVRKNWSDNIDEVVQQHKPKFIARNNKNPFIMMSLDQAKLTYQAYTFKTLLEQEEDGTFSVDLADFDLFVNAESKETAFRKLAEDLNEYAEEYFENIQLYYNAPNRRAHFPFIMNVLLQDDVNGVMRLLNA
jgi:antitoxin YefM